MFRLADPLGFEELVWHFDAGDHRFHPDNIIWDSREANIIAVTDRKTGNITWRLGPNYDGSEAERKLGPCMSI